MCALLGCWLWRGHGGDECVSAQKSQATGTSHACVLSGGRLCEAHPWARAWMTPNKAHCVEVSYGRQEIYELQTSFHLLVSAPLWWKEGFGSYNPKTHLALGPLSGH